MRVADSLFALQQYRKASLAYEYFLFSNPQKHEAHFRALYQKALAQQAEGLHGAALASLNRVNIFTLNEAQKKQLYLKQAVLMLVTGKYAEANFTLLKLKGISSGNLEADLLLCLAEVYDKKWELAQSHFRDVVKKYELQTQDASIVAQNLLDNPPELKSEEHLFYYSILPGLGMVYVDELGEGLLNFSLNAAPLAMGVYSIYLGYYVTGYVVGSTLLEKFYFGGRERSKYLLRRNNHKKASFYQNEVKTQFMKLLAAVLAQKNAIE